MPATMRPMSMVANVILAYSIADDDGETQQQELLARINRFFRDGEGFTEPGYGGTKALEHPTFIAAFNHLDLDGFIAHLKTIEWKEPEHVQLFVCEQEDDSYTLISPCLASAR